MFSSFVQHHTKGLFQRSRKSSRPSATTTTVRSSSEREQLKNLNLYLDASQSPSDLDTAIQTLVEIQQKRTDALSAHAVDEDGLERAVLEKITVGIYAQALELLLQEALESEREAEWWEQVERSPTNVAWYLLQTLPLRVVNLLHTIIHALRRQNIPIRPSQFTPSSLRLLFPSADGMRPNTLTIALFPHLQDQEHMISFVPPRVQNIASKASTWTHILFLLINAPLGLTRQECSSKRKKLESLTNSQAAALGDLVSRRRELDEALNGTKFAIPAFILNIETILPISSFPRPHNHSTTGRGFAGNLQSHMLNLQAHSLFTRAELKTLRRPAKLTLMWPRIILLPPALLYGLRALYASRASLLEVATDTYDTLKQFLRGWLLEPLKDVVHTVRANRDEGVLIRKEGINADFESLERMTLSLAKDQLNYGPEQLAILSQQIKQGDLTPVLHIYEDDIKQPLKSMVRGNLLRSVFIQVQKAKVDLDQALSGIDKLLKSQELTFGFVGVAPALLSVYVAGGYLRRLLLGGIGRDRYGDRKKRTEVWSALRRIERLLLFSHDSSQVEISPLTAGLLLLSLTRLRTYGENQLPSRSRFRQGFLEDVGDLENPELKRSDKLQVVNRMWRSWGKTLGWDTVADGSRI